MWQRVNHKTVQVGHSMVGVGMAVTDLLDHDQSKPSDQAKKENAAQRRETSVQQAREHPARRERVQRRRIKPPAQTWSGYKSIAGRAVHKTVAAAMDAAEARRTTGANFPEHPQRAQQQPSASPEARPRPGTPPTRPSTVTADRDSSSCYGARRCAYPCAASPAAVWDPRGRCPRTAPSCTGRHAVAVV